MNEYESYIISSNLACAYAENAQYDLALKYAFDCYEIHRNFRYNYSIPISVSLLTLSLIYLASNESQLALDFIEQAFQNVPTNCDSRLLGPLHLCIDKCYFDQNNFSDALSHCQESLEKFTETKNDLALSETHHMLAEIYQNKSNNDMSIEHYEKCLSFQKNIYSNNHRLRLRTISCLANLYYPPEKHDASVYYHLELLNSTESSNYERINKLHNRLAGSYFKLQQYDLAMKHAHLSLISSNQLLDPERIELSYSLIHVADIAEQQQKYDLATEYYEKLIKQSIDCKNFETMEEARSKYISNMTRLTIEQYPNNFVQNMKILSEFYDEYLFNEKIFTFDESQRIIMSILLVYIKTKQYLLGTEQLQIMLNDLEYKANTPDKNRVILFLDMRIAWLFEKDGNLYSAISRYKTTLMKIENFDHNRYTTNIIEIALTCYTNIGTN